MAGDGIVLDSLSQVSQLFLADLKSWIEQSGILIPVNQITGFSGFQAQENDVFVGDETRNNAAYGDLATVGPQLNGLRPGKYILLFGCAFAAGGPAGDTGRISPSINGSVPTDADALTIIDVSQQYHSGSRALLKTLASDTNTVKLQYADSGTVASNFRFRWLTALRYA